MKKRHKKVQYNCFSIKNSIKKGEHLAIYISKQIYGFNMNIAFFYTKLSFTMIKNYLGKINTKSNL
jgi:hypothetical protein